MVPRDRARRLSAVVGLSVLITVLCACGQVGPLYLPESPSESSPDTSTDDEKDRRDADSNP